MSTEAQTSPVNKPKIGPNMALLVGRVTEVKKRDGIVYTGLSVPAVDLHSHPGHLQIRSKARLGQPEEDVQVVVRIGGFSRLNNWVDRETGEKLSQRFYTNTFDAVED